MKKIIPIIVVSSFILGACNPLKKMVKRKDEVIVNLTPDPLKLKGDSIKLRIAGSFPQKYFHKKVSAEVTPVLVYGAGNQELELDPFVLKGERLEIADAQEINYKQGGNFAYTAHIPYRDGMEQAVLKLRAKGNFKSKSKVLDSREIGKGTMVTQLLVDNDAKVIVAKDRFEKYYSREMKATVNYLVNRFNVRRSELNDADIKAISDRSQLWASSGKIEVTEINVDGYASPEGEIERNNTLGKNRSETASQLVTKILDKRELSYDNTKMSISSRGEDWEGFKSMLAKSDIQDKNKIINVISLTTDPMEREKEMKKVAVIYKDIKAKILPPLRRSEIRLVTKHLNYTDDELREVVNTGKGINELDENQMLYASTLFKENRTKQEAIYKAFFSKFPKDWRGPNNMGVIYFNKGNLSKAKAMFDKALTLENKDVVYNNLAAVEKKNGNIEKAIELLEKARGAGNEVIENMGSIYISKGEYSKAVAAYNQVTSFNAALAALLGTGNAQAQAIINKVNDPDNAKVYYLKAIINARLNDAGQAAEDLKAAFGRDASLKDKARIDVEFDRIRDDVAIKAILN